MIRKSKSNIYSTRWGTYLLVGKPHNPQKSCISRRISEGEGIIEVPESIFDSMLKEEIRNRLELGLYHDGVFRRVNNVPFYGIPCIAPGVYCIAGNYVNQKQRKKLKIEHLVEDGEIMIEVPEYLISCVAQSMIDKKINFPEDLN